MRIIKAGATSQTIYVEILDSTSTTGGRKTGLVFNTSSLVAYYVLNGGSATAITLATLAAANSAYSSGGFKEVDATNMPGIYRLDLPDAAVASGPSVVVALKGATGMVQVSVEIQLFATNPQDSVRAGMTALPNAAAEAAGGLYTRGTGAGQINQPANGRVDTNPVSLAGTTLTGRDIGASVLLSTGTGTGQLDFTSGVVKANLAQILGTAITETAGQIAAAFKKWFDVAAPVGTVNSIPNATAGAAGGLFIAGTNAATTITTALTTTFTGNLTGSVASVTAGVTLAAAAVQAIWDAAASALTTVGSIGKRLVDDLTGDIYARLGAPAGASMSADIAAVKADTAAVKVQTDKLAFTVTNQVDANVLDWKSATAPAMTGDAFARLGAPAGASVSADIAQVEANVLTGIGYVDTEVAAIKAKTDNLPASPAAVGSAMTLTAAYDTAKTAAQAGDAMTLTGAYNAAKTAAQAGDAMALTTAAQAAAADKLLGRNLAGGADGTRTVQDALRLLRNKRAVAAGTLTVYQEDDSTPAWTAGVATAASDPIDSIDPA